jgi:hypothetical protein
VSVRTTGAAVLALLLAACAEPVPPARESFLGEWRSTEKEMYLLILADGTVRYRRLKRGAKVEITGPLRAWHGNDFEVGFGPFSTRFEVSAPPHEDGGRWTMTVDGVELTRVGMPGAV